MKLAKLIKVLQKIETQLDCDTDIVVDFDEDEGFYSLQNASVVSDSNGEVMVNLESDSEV